MGFRADGRGHWVHCCMRAYRSGNTARNGNRRPSIGRDARIFKLDLEQGRKLSALDLMSALKKVNGVSRSFAAFFENHDIWLTPTMGALPPLLGYLDSSSSDVGLLMTRFSELYRFNSVYNASGLPAMTLPLHFSRSGLPIGMMFGAGFGKEAILFRLAGQLERAMPWAGRHPPHSLWT